MTEQPTCRVDYLRANFTPFFLLANARRIASAEYRRNPNWVLAMELFAVGSNSAIAICKEAAAQPAQSLYAGLTPVQDPELVSRIQAVRHSVGTIRAADEALQLAQPQAAEQSECSQVVALKARLEEITTLNCKNAGENGRLKKRIRELEAAAQKESVPLSDSQRLSSESVQLFNQMLVRASEIDGAMPADAQPVAISLLMRANNAIKQSDPNRWSGITYDIDKYLANTPAPVQPREEVQLDCYPSCGYIGGECDYPSCKSSAVQPVPQLTDEEIVQAAKQADGTGSVRLICKDSKGKEIPTFVAKTFARAIRGEAAQKGSAE